MGCNLNEIKIKSEITFTPVYHIYELVLKFHQTSEYSEACLHFKIIKILLERC